jgi:peptidoglycan/xylan/chitin deacetylase (PgdA/CDA1 family)
MRALVDIATPRAARPRDERTRAAAPPEIGSAPGWPVVLYFHHVHPELRHYTSVTPAAFDRALAELAERFERLEPQAVQSVLAAGGHPAPACLLTFDDGYADVFDNALPLLERRGWRAVVFVSVDLVGRVQRHPVRGQLRHMSWGQLEELVGRGHVVASHGSTHVAFRWLDAVAAQAEVDRARRVLQERLPGAPDWLAYPFGELPTAAGVRLPSLAFGSIKAPARPWNAAPHEIRRTYLPADEPQRWSRCLTEWRRPWGPNGSH